MRGAAALSLAALLTLTSLPVAAYTHRGAAARNHFKRLHPCPATGLATGRCKGWIIDHRVGLCVGGPDTPSNMRWMTVEAAKAKDKWECRSGWGAKLEQCELRGCFDVPH